MRIIFIVAIALLLNVKAEGVKPVREIAPDSIKSCFNNVKFKLGENKTIPQNVAMQFFAALSYYPDLANVKIVVKEKNIKTTMQCRPRFDFLIRKKENRVYYIFIDNKRKKNKGVLFDEVPFNAQVGVIGHELAHVIDYESKKSGQILLLGIQYLSYKHRQKIENNIDMLAVNRGLGHQIHDFSKYVFEDSNASKDYLNYKKRFYYQPRFFNKLLTRLPLYIK